MPNFFSPAILASGKTYRREILAMLPVLLEPIIAHMTPRYGIQGEQAVGNLTNKAQLRPYNSNHQVTQTTAMDMRSIFTYLGKVVEDFDPQEIWDTLYGVTVGDDTTESEIARQVALAMAMSVGENLALSVWTASRNPSGDKTTDLFNGFETILTAEKAAGKLSESNRNLLVLGSTDENNVVDNLKELYRYAHEVLRGKFTKMFLPYDVYNMYNDCYQDNHGHVPYNTQFTKTTLEGSDGKCELVPMTGMSKTKVILTTKKNMLVGMDQTGTREKVEIRRPENPFHLQFSMLSYFGVEFERIEDRSLCVGEISL